MLAFPTTCAGALEGVRDNRLACCGGVRGGVLGCVRGGVLGEVFDAVRAAVLEDRGVEFGGPFGFQGGMLAHSESAVHVGRQDKSPSRSL